MPTSTSGWNISLHSSASKIEELNTTEKNGTITSEVVAIHECTFSIHMENNAPKPDVYVEIRMDGILFEHFLFSKEQHQISCYGWQDEENVIHRYLWVRSSALRCRTLEKLNKTTRSEQQGTIRVTLYEFDRQRLRISSDWICSRHEHVKRPSPSRLYPPSGREKPSHYAHIGAKKSNRAAYKVQRSHSILNRCSILGVVPMLTVIFDYTKSVRKPSVVSRPRQTEVPMTTTHNHRTRRNNMLNNPQTSSQQPAQMPVGNRVTEGGGMQSRSDNARQSAQVVKEEPADDSNLLGYNARPAMNNHSASSSSGFGDNDLNRQILLNTLSKCEKEKRKLEMDIAALNTVLRMPMVHDVIDLTMDSDEDDARPLASRVAGPTSSTKHRRCS